MKTAVTIKKTVQISMDEWDVRRITKVFEDDAKISDIKKFISSVRDGEPTKYKDVSLALVEISDVFE